MTIILAIAGWFAVSTVCTPLIGRFLHAIDLQPTPPVRHVEARSAFSAQIPRREAHHRRGASHAWPRKAVHQPRAG